MRTEFLLGNFALDLLKAKVSSTKRWLDLSFDTSQSPFLRQDNIMIFNLEIRLYILRIILSAALVNSEIHSKHAEAK